MQKWLCIGVLLIICLITSITHAQQQDDLSFHVTFDHKTVAADVASGNAKALAFTDNLEFRTVPGPDLSNAFRIENGEHLTYEAGKNISHREGTAVMWLMAENYGPDQVSMDQPTLNHKPYLTVKWKADADWITLHAYQYFNDSRAMFYWNSSWSKPRDYRVISASLSDIQQGEWFQLAVSWDTQQIRIYLNGELQSETGLVQELVGKVENFRPIASRSTIGVLEPFFKPHDPEEHTLIDDLRIYRRVLADFEIRRLYQAVAGSTDVASEQPDFGIRLDGVDDGGPLDRLDMQLDYRPLDVEWRKAIESQSVEAAATITDPDGLTHAERWRPEALQEKRILSQITKPGEYRVSVTLERAGQVTVVASQVVTRPNTDWADNERGLADVVPSPWLPVRVEDGYRVQVWGREYDFSDGQGGVQPWPRQVMHSGDALLAQGPQLVVVTNQGQEKLVYSLVRVRDQAQSFVEFEGTGTSENLSLTWTTRVDFDGLVRTDFQINGQPTIHRMAVQWVVDSSYAQYLLDPLLQVSGHGVYETVFPYDARKSATLLWLTSRTKGFCWMPEHDANWIYADADAKPIRATIDDDGGHCVVEMIGQPATVPAGTAYHTMFMATPTRPLPKNARTFAMGGYGQYDAGDTGIILHAGEGQDGVFSLKPTDLFEQAMERFTAMKGALVYAGAAALNNYCEEGRYFSKYWDIPGGPVVPFHDPISGNDFLQTNPDPGTRYSDYIIRNLEELYDHPAAGKIDGIYYDLANNYVCSNPLHGCHFKDVFGRKINRMVIMGMRRHLLRTLRVTRQRDKIVMLHAHSYYNPALHGLADFWLPGEQYSAMVRQEDSPYVYSDLISDDVFHSELNMHTKGVAVRFLPALSRAKQGFGTTEHTKAMCTPLLLHDIPIYLAYVDGNVINRIWTIAKAYELDDAEVILYDDPNNVVSVDNNAVLVTYYKCADGRMLLIAGNNTSKTQQVTLKLAAMLGSSSPAEVVDAYEGQALDLVQGELEISLESRMFMIIGVMP